jgi:hypothetical protein
VAAFSPASTKPARSAAGRAFSGLFGLYSRCLAWFLLFGCGRFGCEGYLAEICGSQFIPSWLAALELCVETKKPVVIKTS